MHGFCDRYEAPSVLVITGTPGCGKSALMARFTEEALRRHPDQLILGHFVRASPSSTSLRQMLRRLCTLLNRATGATEDAPEDIKELLKLFSSGKHHRRWKTSVRKGEPRLRSVKARPPRSCVQRERTL
jgi:KaiC/GvpD/RAD55 family RecA-like ATPase